MRVVTIHLGILSEAANRTVLRTILGEASFSVDSFFGRLRVGGFLFQKSMGISVAGDYPSVPH